MLLAILFIIESGKGLSTARRHETITGEPMLKVNNTLMEKLSEIKLQYFLFKKLHLKMSSAKTW